MVWKLADAKNKFSKVVDMALAEGPQTVARRTEAVVVVALRDFEKLTGKKPGFKEFLTSAPSLKGLDLKRDRSGPREVRL